MPYTPPNFSNAPTAYMRANGLLEKKPIYYVSFGLVTGPLGTNSQALPDEYTTGPIKNATKSRKIIMSTPHGYASEFDPIVYTSTLGEARFDLNNKDGEGTKLVTNYILKNRYVTIYRGFDFLDESDYIVIYKGQINNVVRSNDGTYYTFIISDPKKQLVNTILDGHTSLSQDYTVGDSVIYVNPVNGFAAATIQGQGTDWRNWLRIGDNLYQYSSVSTGGLIQDGQLLLQFVRYGPPDVNAVPWVAQWLPTTPYINNQLISNLNFIYRVTNGPGQSGTGGGPTGFGTGSLLFSGVAIDWPENIGNPGDQNYHIGDSVDNFVQFSGHPIDLILKILMTTSGSPGPNHAPTGTNYDVFPKGQGIGVPWYQIAISNFEKQKTLMGAMTFHGYFQDSTQALKFIEDNILQQAHIMVFMNREGLIDCKAIFDTIDTTGAITLDETNVIGQPMFDNNLPTGNQFLNSIWVNYNYKPITDYYSKTEWEIESDSQTDYREEYPLKVDSKFINSSYGGDALAQKCIDTFAARFKRPPPKITCMTFDAVHLLDPGSIVILDHPNVPNYMTGKDGGPISCQVINVEPDFPTGQVRVILLAIGWYG